MADSKSASFEASLARLQEIVKKLEGDDVELEQSVALYKEGRDLVERCEQLLRSAEETLRQAGGAPAAAPSAAFDDDALDTEIPF